MSEELGDSPSRRDGQNIAIIASDSSKEEGKEEIKTGGGLRGRIGTGGGGLSIATNKLGSIFNFYLNL
jgi:hypothetical protein